MKAHVQISICGALRQQIRPHRRCWGVIVRMALVKGYRFTWGGGPIFRPKPPVFDRSWRSPSKNTVKNSERARPKSASEKWKTPVFFNFLTSIFWFATSFFAVPQVAWRGGGFLSFWTRFRTDLSFCDSRNTGFLQCFSVFCMLDG